jgi:DNA-binding MarR family transcriptional regulator
MPVAAAPHLTPSTTDGTDLSDFTGLAVDLLVTSARFTRLASRESDLTIPHALWRALSQVEELGPLRISELAAADRCSQPTATTTVQKLEERGWVRREADAADARAVRISITAAGREQLADNRRTAGERLAARMARLSADDRRDLAAGVVALHHLIEDTSSSRHDSTTEENE